MTKREREALDEALKNEFTDSNEEEMRKGYREFSRQLRLAQEEMGLSRQEAILFLATLLGNSLKP